MPAEFQIYYLIAAGVMGLLLGSFLNVCIYRVPRDLSIVTPRSFCPECGHTVAWYDNIPVWSYVVLGGRCRRCEKKIGFRYPIVELATAALFVAVGRRYGWSVTALKWMVFELLLVVLFWTDFEEQILPDEFTLGGTIAGLIFGVFTMVPGAFAPLFVPEWPTWGRSFFNAALGSAVLAIPIWLAGALYQVFRKREGLGFGDVKLLMMFGVFLGLENGLLALLMGTVTGSLVGLIYALAARKKLSEAQLPFGSFLCAGAAIVPLLKTLEGSGAGP